MTSTVRAQRHKVPQSVTSIRQNGSCRAHDSTRLPDGKRVYAGRFVRHYANQVVLRDSVHDFSWVPKAMHHFGPSLAEYQFN